MAKSGYKSVAVTNQDTLKFSWWFNDGDQSVANNNTLVRWKLELIAGSAGKIISTGSKSWKVVVNGSSYSGTNTIGISNNSTKTLASGTTTIPHNDDGTKTFEYSFEQTIAIEWGSTYIDKASSSSKGTLDTIPRASSVAATTANVESAAVFTITKANNSFTHTLKYQFGDLSGTIVTKTSDSTVTWTIPTTFYGEMPNEKVKTGTITCTTYSENEVVGTSTCDFKVTTNQSLCEPTLSPRLFISSTSDTYKYTGSTSKFIKDYTWVSYEVNSEARNGATIKNRRVSCGQQVYTEETGQFNAGITTNVFEFTVTDSRGYTATRTIEANVVDYISLTCNVNARIRPDGTINMSVSGLYYNGSFGAKKNTLTAYYRYKVLGGTYSDWIVTNVTINGNSYSLETTISNLDYEQTYVVQAKVTDELSSKTSNEPTLTCIPVFDWGKKDFAVNVDFHFAGKTVVGALLGLCGCSGFIASGDNFNNYLTPGVWGVTSNAIAASLMNCPDKIAGRLIVCNATGDSRITGSWVYLLQEYVPMNPTQPTYKRLAQTNASGVFDFGYWYSSGTPTKIS